ncbi:flagellar protein [Paenibacillus agricola]|uniref:Flagellar protein n=1 Tax=Paenibacillus agricola TaxID=2716264 RepID=A0ABX0IYL5_9BACL|nr:flagellar protein [Paenibacillus agricola]NHN28793.1 flagellar protein [Paenibacillus agricola]
MSILMVANCPGCGKVFQKNLRNLCSYCVIALQSEFDACDRYLRSNRKSTTQQLSMATGVSEKQIMLWIKERRLSPSDYPNLTYPCNSCREPIRQQEMCMSCRTRLTNDIREMQAKEVKPLIYNTAYKSHTNRY